MQVKTQKQVLVLQNKAQKVADKLTEEVIFITKEKIIASILKQELKNKALYLGHFGC
jgi:hypothetical protein